MEKTVTKVENTINATSILDQTEHLGNGTVFYGLLRQFPKILGHHNQGSKYERVTGKIKV